MKKHQKITMAPPRNSKNQKIKLEMKEEVKMKEQ